MEWVRIRRNVPLRIAEWPCSLMTIGVGLYLVVWPLAFQRAGVSGFAALGLINIWVGASLLLGTARIRALVLNGTSPRYRQPFGAGWLSWVSVSSLRSPPATP